MLEQCDRRAESAEKFGAVNTVVNENGILVGHSTDGMGWSRALREAFDRGPADLRILLLGAGGAGRAVAIQALLENCPRLVIANRNAGRARALADELEARTLLRGGARGPPPGRGVGGNSRRARRHRPGRQRHLDRPRPRAPPVLSARVLFRPAAGLRHRLRRRLREFPAEVEAAGARWSDGLGMLLHQGAAAFTLWTGRDAPLDVMREALQGAFSASRR